MHEGKHGPERVLKGRMFTLCTIINPWLWCCLCHYSVEALSARTEDLGVFALWICVHCLCWAHWFWPRNGRKMIFFKKKSVTFPDGLERSWFPWRFFSLFLHEGLHFLHGGHLNGPWKGGLTLHCGHFLVTDLLLDLEWCGLPLPLHPLDVLQDFSVPGFMIA